MADTRRRWAETRMRTKDGVRRTVSLEASTRDDYLVCETMGESRKKRHSQSDVLSRFSAQAIHSLSSRRLGFRKRTVSVEEGYVHNILEEVADTGCQDIVGGVPHRNPVSNLVAEDRAVHASATFPNQISHAGCAGCGTQGVNHRHVYEPGRPYRYVVELNCGNGMATETFQNAHSLGQGASKLDRTQWRTGNCHSEAALTSLAARKQSDHRNNQHLLHRWVQCLWGYP